MEKNKLISKINKYLFQNINKNKYNNKKKKFNI